MGVVLSPLRTVIELRSTVRNAAVFQSAPRSVVRISPEGRSPILLRSPAVGGVRLVYEKRNAVHLGQPSTAPKVTLELGRGPQGLSGAAVPTFETVNKNLQSSDSTIAMTGDDIASITYANGIVKTFAYGPDGLASVTLSGNVPGGISLIKTLLYSAGNPAGATYS